MYLDFLIEVPDVQGKITTKKKGNAVYINYEIGRKYYKDRKYTIPERVTIGKLSQEGKKMMVPNQNFLTYFPEVELPEEKFMTGIEKTDAINREISLCGYFVIVTSTKMTAEDALLLYKSRDASEKTVRGDKSYLGHTAKGCTQMSR